MKKLFILFCLAVVSVAPILPQAEGDVFTIYLVRHSERDDEGARVRDPGLSEVGVLRSKRLATIFSETEIERIYSTDYRRTIMTATPVAESKGIEPELYDGTDLSAIHDLLLSRWEDALVVGHSNTTSVLAGMLAGQELHPMCESIYDRLYIVVISGRSARLILLNQGFAG